MVVETRIRLLSEGVEYPMGCATRLQQASHLPSISLIGAAGHARLLRMMSGTCRCIAERRMRHRGARATSWMSPLVAHSVGEGKDPLSHRCKPVLQPTNATTKWIETASKECKHEHVSLPLSCEIEQGATFLVGNDGAHEQYSDQALPGGARPVDERSESRRTQSHRWTDCRGAGHQSPHRDSYQAAVCPKEPGGGSHRELSPRAS